MFHYGRQTPHYVGAGKTFAKNVRYASQNGSAYALPFYRFAVKHMRELSPEDVLIKRKFLPSWGKSGR